MTRTTYTVRCERDCYSVTTSPERAERLSRAGLRVTACTRGGE